VKPDNLLTMISQHSHHFDKAENAIQNEQAPQFAFAIKDGVFTNM
jgi:hypothetical protein